MPPSPPPPRLDVEAISKTMWEARVSVARWARVAAVCSAAALVLFTVSLVVVDGRVTVTVARPEGPYALPLRVGLVAVGVGLAAMMARRYERLARGRVEGRPRWWVLRAWWALVVISALIAVQWPPSPWPVAAWVAALGWGVAATTASRWERLAHP